MKDLLMAAMLGLITGIGHGVVSHYHNLQDFGEEQTYFWMTDGVSQVRNPHTYLGVSINHGHSS